MSIAGPSRGNDGAVQQRTSTMKPAPPPKPSHLSSAFTGTLNSDALKSYIRQQSQTTVSRFHTIHDAGFVSHSPSSSSSSSSSVASSLNIDTFRTTRQQPFVGLTSAVEAEQSTGETDWGTAKQTLTTMQHPKHALADLFSPPSPTECGQGVRQPFVISGIKDPVMMEDDAPVACTIRAKQSVDLLNIHRQTASAQSSPRSTMRSRQPSVLSRLSSFEDDEDDDLRSAMLNTCSLNKAVDPTSPPRRGWMHARDGSAFERASPRTFGASRLHQSSTIAANTHDKSVRSGLPSVSDGLPILVAGPPPVRPKSIVKSASGNEPLRSLAKSTPVKNKVERGRGRQARALYGFDGEKTFNELSLLAGQVFEILKEDVQDGWSLALAEQHGTWTKGLVPQGWYTYVQEFTASPLHKPAHPDKQSDDQALSSITLGRSSHAEKAAKDNAAQEVGRNDQGLLDVADVPASQRIRPASGVGRMSSGLDESNGARQLLSQFSNTGTPIKGTKTLEIAANTLQVSSNEAATTMSTPTSEMSFDVSSVPDVAAVATAETSASSITTTKSDASKSGWRPPGLLGGRSLNRYSPYVVSGAEQYILADDEERTSSTSFKIVNGAHDGPAWQSDGCELVVEVHSPETHLDERDRPFTAYAVHTSYVESKVDHQHRDLLFDPYVRPEQATYATNVYRRYNQFRWLAGHVQRYYPTLVLAFAPLPDASHGAGRTVRMEPTFVERRRRHLQSWLTTVVRHPVLAADAGVLFFLQSEEEGEDWTWKARELQRKMRYRDASSSSTHLFARTLHPLFNVDVHELTVQAEQIQRFAQVYERCMVETRSGVLDAIKDARQSALNNAECYRQMSLSLLGLITGASTTTTTASKVGQTEHTAGCAPLPPMGNLGMRDGSGATNEDRAWCWREGCAECRRMTLAMQLTAAALQHVAEGYGTYAQTAMFDLHDRTYNASKVQRTTSALFDVQKNALSTYAAASESIESSTTSDEQRTAAERIAARCETVLNVVMGELDRVHDDRVQHWNALSRHMLDEQISFHAEALNGLQTARQRLDGIMHSQHSGRGPILPSPYEEQLIRPLAMPVLQMPSMTLVEPSTAAKAVHPVTFAGEMLSDWLGGGGRQI